MSFFESAFAARLESWILAYLLNSLWQVPLVFGAALAAAWLARPAGPRMEHRVWVGALLLEATLPLCNLHLNELWQRAWGLALFFFHGGAPDGETRVILGAGTASRMALPWHTAEILAAVAVAYLCGLLYFAGRLGWCVWITEAMRRRAVRLELTPETAWQVDRLQPASETTADGFAGGRSSAVGHFARVHFATSADISGPATVGVRRQTLLLPLGFLDKLSCDELDAVLAHEFAHMRRWDFAKNLLYGLVAIPVAYHPLLWLTRARVAETRELVCDAMAADAVGGRESYARSLLRLASMLSDRAAPRILHAIGIFDANIFERRVMNLTRKSLEIGRGRRLAIIGACALVALVTCASALALRMDVTEPSAQNPSTKSIDVTPKSINVKSDALTLVSKVNPVYPVDAKKERVQGTVELAAVIGKDGTVENLSVVSGPDALQKSALDAVKDWRYQPFLLNGDPIEVKTTIKVIYTLAQ
jgi:TonB family protein